MSKASQPKYRHYKPKNLAVVRIDGKDHYLGAYNSPESWEKYHRLMAERLAQKAEPVADPKSPTEISPDLTINQLLNHYRQFAETYYVYDNQPTKELVEMKHAARPLRKLYGRMQARGFGPLCLKSIRTHMIEKEGLSRGVINNRVNRIKRIFKWAVSEQLVPSSVYEGLRTVDGLRFGRTNARETEPVKPVAWEHVEPVLDWTSPQVAAMISLQWLTGMRPCEVVILRGCDIDRSGEIWIYEPHDHKNRWRGHSRQIPLGPKSQEVLQPFLHGAEGNYLFSPQAAEAHRNATRRANRQSPMTPSQSKRKPKRRPKRAKRNRYDVDSYRRAIRYAITKANKHRTEADQLPLWYPLQLRHSRATEIRKQFGLEAAQVALGHVHADVTQVYAERNLQAAIRIAREVG